MAKKSEAPPAPNYGPIVQASQQSAQLSYQLGQQQLEWAQQQYAQDAALTGQVVNSLLQTQAQNQANAQEDRDRYETIFQPLEDQLAAEAADYATPERKELEIGRAQGAVAQQFEQARDAARRELESYGINPGATRYAALDIGTRAQQAAASAAAGNQASQMVDATGRALRSEAINVGRGYPGQIAGQYGTAMNAGQGAVGSNLNTTASGASTMGTGAQWTGLGNQGLSIWGNTLNQGYQNQLAQFNANQQASSGIGAIAGLVGGALMSPSKPWLFAAEGGAIPEPTQTTGGAVPVEASPTRGKAIDDVSARLSPGEFVVPKDTVDWLGEKHFQQLIEKSRMEKERATAKPTVRSAIPMPPTYQSRPTAALPV